LATEPVWSLYRRGRNFAMLGNEAGLFGHPTLKLVTVVTQMFRLTADLKDHRVGYPRTVVLKAISPVIKIVKLRKKKVG